jgi:hypothetical protein
VKLGRHCQPLYQWYLNRRTTAILAVIDDLLGLPDITARDVTNQHRESPGVRDAIMLVNGQLSHDIGPVTNLSQPAIPIVRP